MCMIMKEMRLLYLCEYVVFKICLDESDTVKRGGRGEGGGGDFIQIT